MHIYTSDEVAIFYFLATRLCRAASGSFALQSIDSETLSFFHIVGWLKNLQIRLFAMAWHWVTLGDLWNQFVLQVPFQVLW